MLVLRDLLNGQAEPLRNEWDTAVFGCCGARYVTDAPSFNDFTETDPKEHWSAAVCFRQFNRGILLGKGIKEEDIVQSDTTLVESFTLEGETFFVRIRK
jgi:hypothetical protein